MSTAALYAKSNDIQKNEATYVLDKYFQLVNWKNDGTDAVLDIGCGTGGVTIDVLLPRISTAGFKKLTGIDLSEEMIKFAETHHSDPRVTFQQMDITAEQIPTGFENAFDHAFSFFCLHWVRDQKKAIENIFRMLAPGGDTLLAFISSNLIYRAYETLSKRNLWEAYMKDFSKYVSPYCDSANPEKQFRELLNKQGFEVKVFNQEQRRQCSEMDDITNGLRGTNPIYTKIPDTLKEKYLNDISRELEELKVFQIADDNSVIITFNLFVIHACKPLQE